jgi:hypothetical protein
MLLVARQVEQLSGLRRTASVAAEIEPVHLPGAGLAVHDCAPCEHAPRKRRGDVLLHVQVIGSISGSGRITLVDNKAPAGEPTPVDLDLEKARAALQRQQPPINCFLVLHSHTRDALSDEEYILRQTADPPSGVKGRSSIRIVTSPSQVLGDMPQKTFEFTRRTEATAALDLSGAASPQEALDKVRCLSAMCQRDLCGCPVRACSQQRSRAPCHAGAEAAGCLLEALPHHKGGQVCHRYSACSYPSLDSNRLSYFCSMHPAPRQRSL